MFFSEVETIQRMRVYLRGTWCLVSLDTERMIVEAVCLTCLVTLRLRRLMPKVVDIAVDVHGSRRCLVDGFMNVLMLIYPTPPCIRRRRLLRTVVVSIFNHLSLCPWTGQRRSFQSILGLLRADDCMSALAGKYQGTEKGGRSLLAKVCKLQEDLEIISHTMDRRVSGCKH